MYQTASEVVREGLRLLRERDQRIEALRRDIRAGFEAVERGEFTDYDESTIHELGAPVKARGRQRLVDEESGTGASLKRIRVATRSGSAEIADGVVDSATAAFAVISGNPEAGSR